MTRQLDGPDQAAKIAIYGLKDKNAYLTVPINLVLKHVTEIGRTSGGVSPHYNFTLTMMLLGGTST